MVPAARTVLPPVNAADLQNLVLWFVPVLLSLTVHEWAHAASANALGDDTAAREPDVDVYRLLAVYQLNRCAIARCPSLPEGPVDVARLGCRDRVAASGKRGHAISSLLIRACCTRTPAAADHHTCTPEWTACIRGDDSTSNRCRSRRCGDVPRRCRTAASAARTCRASLSTALRRLALFRGGRLLRED